MSQYCNILRTNPDEALKVQVARPETEERLEGTLNTDEKLKKVEEQSQPGSTAESGYTEVTDDTGSIAVDVPVECDEVNTSPSSIFENLEEGPVIAASPDMDGFYNTYETPGVYFAASETILQEYDENAVLDSFDRSGDCDLVDDGRQDYDDGTYTGRINFWTNCGGVEGRGALDLAAVPADRSFLLYLHVKIVSEADGQAAEQILNTFRVV